MRKSYPSDITKEQFEIIREDLEQATKKTHPRKYDLYDIFLCHTVLAERRLFMESDTA